MSTPSGVVYVPDSPDLPVYPEQVQKQIDRAHELIAWQQDVLAHNRRLEAWKTADWCTRALMFIGAL